MKKFMWVAMLFCAVWCSQAWAVVIFSDGFEAGDFSAWTSASGRWQLASSASYAHSGSWRAVVEGGNDPNGDALLLANSSAGFQNIVLEYWYDTTSYNLESGDHVYAEWTADGTQWEVLADYTSTTNNPWALASFDLPATANDNPLLQVRIRASCSDLSDKMGFDDFLLQGTPVPEPATLILLLCAPLAVAWRKSQS